MDSSEMKNAPLAENQDGKAVDSPDSFEQARQEAPDGSDPRHPNRAQSEGAFEATVETPAEGWAPRGEPPLDTPPEQALDEALELTFPGSDPVSAQGCTRIEIDPDGQLREVASGAACEPPSDD